MQKQILMVLAVVVSLVIGFFVGTKIPKAQPQAEINKVDNNFQSGWDAAMKSLKESGVLPQFSENTEIKSMNAIVQEISGKNLTVKVVTPGLLSTAALMTRTIVLDSNTKVSEIVYKDQAQIQKENEAFNEKMKQQGAQASNDPKDRPTPPQTQDSKAAAIGDIKVGQTIMINAAEDIKNKQQITATTISILGQAPTPPTVKPQIPDNLTK